MYQSVRRARCVNHVITLGGYRVAQAIGDPAVPSSTAARGTAGRRHRYRRRLVRCDRLIGSDAAHPPIVSKRTGMCCVQRHERRQAVFRLPVQGLCRTTVAVTAPEGVEVRRGNASSLILPTGSDAPHERPLTGAPEGHRSEVAGAFGSASQREVNAGPGITATGSGARLTPSNLRSCPVVTIRRSCEPPRPVDSVGGGTTRRHRRCRHACPAPRTAVTRTGAADGCLFGVSIPRTTGESRFRNAGSAQSRRRTEDRL